MKWSCRVAVFAFAFVVSAIVASGIAEAQGRGGGRGGFRGGFGGFRGGGRFAGGPIQLALREDVQKELGLSSGQIADIEQLADNQSASIRELFAQRPGGAGPGRRGGDQPRGGGRRGRGQGGPFGGGAFARIQERMEQVNKDTRDALARILDRSQQTRFAEIEFQNNVRRGQLAEALAAAGVDLSGGDSDALENAQQDARAEIEAKIADLRLEAFTEALGSIVGRSKVDEMMGQPFEFDTSAGRPRRGPGDDDRRDGGRGRRRARGDAAGDEEEASDEPTSRRRRR